MRRALPHRCSASLHAPVLHSSIGLSRGASRPCAARSRGEAKRSRGMFAPPLRAAEPAPLGAVRALLTRCVTAADAMLSAPRSQRGPSRSIGASILRARDTAAHIGNGSARRTLLWLQALCGDRGRGIVPVAFCMRSRIPMSVALRAGTLSCAQTPRSCCCLGRRRCHCHPCYLLEPAARNAQTP